MQVIWDFIHGTGIVLFVVGTLIISSLFSSPSSEMFHQKQVLDSLPKYSNSADYKIETGGGISTPKSYNASFQSSDSTNKFLEYYKEAMSKNGWYEKSLTKETNQTSNGSTYAGLEMANGVDEVFISYRDHGEFGIQVSKEYSGD